jgi:hypothetical protein
MSSAGVSLVMQDGARACRLICSEAVRIGLPVQYCRAVP